MKVMRLFAAFVAALALTACSSERIDTSDVTGKAPTPLRFTTRIAEMTRATDTHTQFAAGEEVSIAVPKAYITSDASDAGTPLYVSFVEHTADGNGNLTRTTEMSVDMDSYKTFYVDAIHGDYEKLYDAPAGNYYYNVKVAEDQTSEDNYRKSDFLCSFQTATAPNVTLAFKHYFSKLEVSVVNESGLSETPTSIVVGGTATDDEKIELNGNYNASVPRNNGSDVELIRWDSMGQKDKGTVTMSCAMTTDPNSKVLNAAIIVPQNMSGKKMYFNYADGKQAVLVFPANTTFEAGKKYIYHVTLVPNGTATGNVKFTTTIESWNEGNGNGSDVRVDAPAATTGN